MLLSEGQMSDYKGAALMLKPLDPQRHHIAGLEPLLPRLHAERQLPFTMIGDYCMPRRSLHPRRWAA